MKIAKPAILIGVDSAIIAVVCVLVGWLFPNMGSVAMIGYVSVGTVLVFILCTVGIRALCGIYSAIWRYANTRSYTVQLCADAVSCLVIFVLGRFSALQQVDLGASYVLVCMLLIALITLSSRFIYRMLYDLVNAKRAAGTGERREKINIAIVGAGSVGSALAEELQRNPGAQYRAVCFVDKDSSKTGKRLRGLPILGRGSRLAEELEHLNVREAVVALTNISAEERMRLYETYNGMGLRMRLFDYPLGDAASESGPVLRDFAIEDLLFREPLLIRDAPVLTYYAGKRVMVTGGGGSIGAELCRQLARLKVASLVIVDNYENNAYAIQQELQRMYGAALPLKTVIATVRDRDRLEEIFRAERPQIVFHAAAHKHVPLMEDAAAEAVKNNVLGTYNVADMAEKYGVEKFLLISTDKAVNPTNVMGASKRLCEMVIQCRRDSVTAFTAVRFGNVLGSNGSVIPLFKQQIAAGGPVTLTDKRIIRYFMSIAEAVSLVMETAAMAKNGELYVLDMGKPVKILDMAEKMIRLSGLVPYRDIDIVEIGLRPGEKLYEELLLRAEELEKTANDMIFVERDRGESRQQVEQKLAVLRKALLAEDNEAVKQALHATVSTYHEAREVNAAAVEERKIDAMQEDTAQEKTATAVS